MRSHDQFYSHKTDRKQTDKQQYRKSTPTVDSESLLFDEAVIQRMTQ